MPFAQYANHSAPLNRWHWLVASVAVSLSQPGFVPWHLDVQYVPSANTGSSHLSARLVVHLGSQLSRRARWE
jgi:hypothetical protein